MGSVVVCSSGLQLTLIMRKNHGMGRGWSRGMWSQEGSGVQGGWANDGLGMGYVCKTL